MRSVARVALAAAPLGRQLALAHRGRTKTLPAAVAAGPVSSFPEAYEALGR
jgi:hypothetical protein